VSGRARRSGSSRSGQPGVARAVRGTRWRDIQWVDFASADSAEATEPTPEDEPNSAMAPPNDPGKFDAVLRQFAEPALASGRADIPGLASRFARVPVPRPVAPGAEPAGLVVSILARLATAPSPAEIEHPDAELAAAPEHFPIRAAAGPAAPEPPLASALPADAPAEDDFPASIRTPVGSAVEPPAPASSIAQTLGEQLGQAGAVWRRQRDSVGTAVSASLVRVHATLRTRWPTPPSARLSQAGAVLRRHRESMGVAIGDHLVRVRAALRTRWPTPTPPAKIDPDSAPRKTPAPLFVPPRATIAAPQPVALPEVEAAEVIPPVSPELRPATPTPASVLAGHIHAMALRLAGGDPERLRRWLSVAGTAIAVALAAYVIGAMIAGLASSDTRLRIVSNKPAPGTQTATAQPQAQTQQPPPQPAAAATPPSEPVARAAFYLARAKTGDAVAQYDIGVLYAQGSGLVQDYASAASWFHAAAAQGVVDAEYNLGVLYESGLGVTANPIDAINWYRSAADQNHAAAQYNLAIAYTEGRGTEQDLAAAARWYQRAAKQGLAPAMFNLAIFYERGQGIDRSPVEAYAWYSAAAERGYAAAKQRAGELFAQFSDQDKARAQGLAATIAASINGAPPA
jgi:TPR repeat protein